MQLGRGTKLIGINGKQPTWTYVEINHRVHCPRSWVQNSCSCAAELLMNGRLTELFYTEEALGLKLLLEFGIWSIESIVQSLVIRTK